MIALLNEKRRRACLAHIETKVTQSLWMLVVLIMFFWTVFIPAGRADPKSPTIVMFEGSAEYPGGEAEMNGYTLAQFGDFLHQWHFVTVRYRRDSGEMRFVYANDIAWNALNQHSTDYPDGAVFAKVGVSTKEDPAFIDSAVPKQADHVQIMVRNHAKHAGTGGWGYAIFDHLGKTSPGPPLDEVSRACDACHQLVPQRGLVFAQAMPDIAVPNVSPPPSDTAASPSPVAANSLFITIDVADLPKNLQRRLPRGTKTIRKMQGKISQHMFQGSMQESIPFVGAEAARSHMPTAILNPENPKLFSAIWPMTSAAPCFVAGRQGQMVEGVFYAVVVVGPNRSAVSSQPQNYMAYMPIPPFCAVADEVVVP